MSSGSCEERLAVEVDEAHPGLRRLVGEEGAGGARVGGPARRL